MTGFITGLNLDRGFGFLKTPEGRSYFWHCSDLVDVPFSEALRGMEVTFDEAPANDRPTPPACNVRPVW